MSSLRGAVLLALSILPLAILQAQPVPTWKRVFCPFDSARLGSGERGIFVEAQKALLINPVTEEVLVSIAADPDYYFDSSFTVSEDGKRFSVVGRKTVNFGGTSRYIAVFDSAGNPVGRFPIVTENGYRYSPGMRYVLFINDDGTQRVVSVATGNVTIPSTTGRIVGENDAYLVEGTDIPSYRNPANGKTMASPYPLPSGVFPYEVFTETVHAYIGGVRTIFPIDGGGPLEYRSGLYDETGYRYAEYPLPFSPSISFYDVRLATPLRTLPKSRYQDGRLTPNRRGFLYKTPTSIRRYGFADNSSAAVGGRELYGAVATSTGGAKLVTDDGKVTVRDAEYGLQSISDAPAIPDRSKGELSRDGSALFFRTPPTRYDIVTGTFDPVLPQGAVVTDADASLRSMLYQLDGRLYRRTEDGKTSVYDASIQRAVFVGSDRIATILKNPDRIRVCESSTGKSTGIFSVGGNRVDDIFPLPDGNQILFRSSSKLGILDLTTRKVRILPGVYYTLQSSPDRQLMEFSADSRRLVLNDDVLKVVDLASGLVILQLADRSYVSEYLENPRYLAPSAFFTDGGRSVVVRHDQTVESYRLPSNP